jgi:hypothetical protein
MEKIKQFFEWDYECYEISEYNGILEAKKENVVYLVVAPHSGTDNRWMLRISTRSAFDRWANSTAIEEFFETDVDLCSYLYEHPLYIYKTLLAYLSEKYDKYY